MIVTDGYASQDDNRMNKGNKVKQYGNIKTKKACGKGRGNHVLVKESSGENYSAVSKKVSVKQHLLTRLAGIGFVVLNSL